MIFEMNNFFVAAVIGISAGLVDIMPMIIKKLDKRDSLSAFVHYFALGLIIPFIDWPIAPWLKGAAVALLSAVPVMLIVYPRDKKAIIPMFLFSVILGAGIGIAGAKFIV